MVAHLPFQVCEPTPRRVASPRDRWTRRAETNGRYSLAPAPAQPLFFTANAQLSLFSGKCMRRSQTARRACTPTRATTLPIDKVARFCQKKTVWGGKEGGRKGALRRRFSISLYTAFQMMTEIKHTLRCRSLGRSVRCVCVETVENCSFFGPILDQLTTTILATFSRRCRRPPSLTPSFVPSCKSWHFLFP